MNIIIPLGHETLKELARNCCSIYICPKSWDGTRKGPLVTYAGKDAKGNNLVGDIYFNFRRIEEQGLVVESFATEIHDQLINSGFLKTFDTVCGIPHGGRTLGQVQARVSGKRFVYADKVPIPTEPGKKQEYAWDLSQFSFEPGERLLLMEDVINNLQNTDNTLAQVAKTGARVVLLGAALNRSPFADKNYTPKTGPFAGQTLPIVAAIREPYPEYSQDDPAVAADIAAGNVEREVKKNWSKLLEAMDLHDTTH